MPTTVDALIYALGGGHGHARRGLLLQRHWAGRGVTAAVLLRPGSDRPFDTDTGPRYYGLSLNDAHFAALLRDPPPHLVIDTFPQGWRGEIGGAWRARFGKVSWIARHSRHAAESNHQNILLPYPEGHDEWERPLRQAHYVGYMIDASHWDLRPEGKNLALLDPERRCGPRLLSAFARAARRVGLGFAHHTGLGQPIGAAKLLVAGAGYHTFYELLGQRVDLRFLPLRKRHDDQFRRAALFGLSLGHLDELLPWLDSPPPPPPPFVPPNWPAVLRHLEM